MCARTLNGLQLPLLYSYKSGSFHDTVHEKSAREEGLAAKTKQH